MVSRNGRPEPDDLPTERVESRGPQEWYVVTEGLSSSMRITPGLTIGESASGLLTLNDPDPATHWVEFVLADNGDPWATLVTRDKSLRVAGSMRLRHPLREGDALRLPNNTLHVSRDISAPPPSGTVVEIVHRDLPEPLLGLLPPDPAHDPAEDHEPPPEEPETTRSELPDFDGLRIPEPRQQPRDAPGFRSSPEAEPARRPPADRRRRTAVLGGMLTLSAVIAAGGVAVIYFGGEAEPTRLEDYQPLDADAAPPGAAEADPPREDVALPSLERRPPPAEASAPAQADAVQGRTTPARVAAPDIDPRLVLLPPVERPPADEVTEPEPALAEPVAVAEPPASTEPSRSTTPPPESSVAAPASSPVIDRGPDPALVAELEQTGEQARTATADLIGERNRLLTELQPRQQTLINRAMARLAANDLDGARRALQAASIAGADPQLVNNLNDEVELRQRQNP